MNRLGGASHHKRIATHPVVNLFRPTAMKQVNIKDRWY